VKLEESKKLFDSSEGGRMTKQELIDRVAQTRKISQTAAKTTVDLIFDGIADELATGGKVEIRGFGSFRVREYQGYTGRNPRFGNFVEVKPKKSPFFRAGKELRERLNSS
jgi:integration host factor subunit beta